MIRDNYFPDNKEFKELKVKFCGFKNKPLDVMCYLKLKSLTKKLNMKYPEYYVCHKFGSLGIFVEYECRAIFEENKDNTKKMNNLKVICNELIKYGMKNESIPMIKFVNHGEKTTIFTLEDYLKSKGIGLEDLSIGKDCNKESIDISR